MNCVITFHNTKKMPDVQFNMLHTLTDLLDEKRDFAGFPKCWKNTNSFSERLLPVYKNAEKYYGKRNIIPDYQASPASSRRTVKNMPGYRNLQ